MTDLYNYVNPKNGRHSPLISKETYDIIMANADVSGKKTVILRLCFRVVIKSRGPGIFPGY